MFMIRTAVVLLAALVGLAASSSFISDDGLKNHGSGGGRSLLQALKDCPMSFEDKNYTIITSKCNASNYRPRPCCEGFKEFACPYASILNDPTTRCSSIMFHYINIKGGYPQGLFASMCRDNKEGLDCSTVNIAPQPPLEANESSNTNESLVSVIFLMCGVILEFLVFFKR